jgi:hypothetical protein
MRRNSMRFSIAVALLLAISISNLYCQSPDELPAERVVSIVLSRASKQEYTAWDAKQLGKLGDAAAVAVTKLLGDRELTADEISQVVVILRLSFSRPELIAVKSDAQPRATLLVLRYLGTLPQSSGLKKGISDARTEIEEAVGKRTDESKAP